jgi:hypothetical protein
MRCAFAVSDIATSIKSWASSSPNGTPSSSNDFLVAQAIFSGLPVNNSAFGSKTASVTFDAIVMKTNPYEVFFLRNAANNPGDTVPNWFFYWGQVYVNVNIDYVVAAGAGRTPAMTDWLYTSAPNKAAIEIGNAHPSKFRSYGIGEETSGIDRYIMTVIHEEKHVVQITAADTRLSTGGSDSFRFGWSWNQSSHNHWTQGADGQWGIAGVDDDGNGAVDDAGMAPPFEPGNGDDISLDNSAWVWWPNSWPLPTEIYATIHPIEGEAVKAADDAMDENDYAPQDWGDPGKNHNTINKWDD